MDQFATQTCGKVPAVAANGEAMRVLVTGSSGRVGRAVCLALSRRHQVRGFDRSPASNTQIVAELHDQQVLKQAMNGVEVVVHVAGLHAPHVDLVADGEFERINVDGTRRVLDAAATAGVRHLVYTSTTAVYGHAARLDDRAAWLDETSPAQPRTIYHRTKLTAEDLLRAAADQGGPTVCILRMSRCFPEAADLMACYRLHRGVDARDVASAHLLAAERSPQSSASYVISAATPFRLGDCERLKFEATAVLKQRAPALSAEFDRRGWALPNSIDRVYSAQAAIDGLGWQPRHGYEAVVDDYDNGVAEVLLPTGWSPS